MEWESFSDCAFSTFLDIRQFMGNPINVDTLLYREVSTFFRSTTIHGKAQKYGYFTIYGGFHIFRYTTIYEKPINVDTLLYREVSTFFRYTTIYGKAHKCGYFTI